MECGAIERKCRVAILSMRGGYGEPCTACQMCIDIIVATGFS